MSGTPVETNPYHYADNDPVNKTDPLGLRPSDDDTFGGPGGGYDVSLAGWGPFDCVFSCPPYSPPGYYDRKEFDIHGVGLEGRGYKLNQCIFFGQTCSAASGKPRAEATAQAHAIRELSSHHGKDRRCTGYDQFQHVRDIFWEVSVPGGRIDILVKQDDPLVDIYEVKQWGLNPFPQLDRYSRGLEGMGLSVALGTELAGWAVKYKINGTDHVAWQDTAGVVWYSPVPDSDKERQRYPELKAVYDRARLVEESDPFGGSPGSGPIPIPVRPPVYV